MFRDRTNLYLSFRSSFDRHSNFLFGNQPNTLNLSSNFSPNLLSNDSENEYHDDDNDNEEESKGLINNKVKGKKLKKNPNKFNYDPYQNKSDSSIIEMDFLPPAWSDISDNINNLLRKAQEQSRELSRLHSKHILPSFNDIDKAKDEINIERLTNSITSLYQECQKEIQNIDVQSKKSSMSNSEKKMAGNLKIALATRVQNSSSIFRKKQSSYLKQLKGIEQDDANIDVDLTHSIDSSGNLDANTIALQEDEQDLKFSQSTLRQQQLQQNKNRQQRGFNDSIISQRELEITKIAEGIVELATIFKELNTMVIDQGTLLDRIDYNIENSKIEIKEASKQLEKGEKYQRRTTKCKIIFLLILIVLALVIILIVKPHKH